MRTHVYVDGFNFYYGCVKGTPFKWLNFHELFRRLLPPNDIRAIKYFTARVEGRPAILAKPPARTPTSGHCRRYLVSKSSWANSHARRDTAPGGRQGL